MFSVPLSFGFWSSCHPACPALRSLHSVLISLAALAAGACRVPVPPLAMGHLSPHPPLLGKAPQLGPEAEAQLVSSYPALSRIWALLGTGLAPCDPHGLALGPFRRARVLALRSAQQNQWPHSQAPGQASSLLLAAPTSLELSQEALLTGHHSCLLVSGCYPFPNLLSWTTCIHITWPVIFPGGLLAPQRQDSGVSGSSWCSVQCWACEKWGFPRWHQW